MHADHVDRVALIGLSEHAAGREVHRVHMVEHLIETDAIWRVVRQERGCTAISRRKLPPNATFNSWKPRQMPNTGLPRLSITSTRRSVIASRSGSNGPTASSA